MVPAVGKNAAILNHTPPSFDDANEILSNYATLNATLTDSQSWDPNIILPLQGDVIFSGNKLCFRGVRMPEYVACE